MLTEINTPKISLLPVADQATVKFLDLKERALVASQLQEFARLNLEVQLAIQAGEITQGESYELQRLIRRRQSRTAYGANSK